jgi:putative endonuclease
LIFSAPFRLSSPDRIEDPDRSIRSIRGKGKTKKIKIMAESHELGQKGEELAVEHLKKGGFKILFRNWKWGKNEIDIIAENTDYIIFAEVKTRTDDYQMHPVSAITKEKQRSIIFAADGYLQKFNINKESRFDVITIIKTDNSFEVDHIESAFYPTLR